MRTTIDAAGRVVIPKRLREAAGLRAGQELEIVATDGRIEIEPVGAVVRLELRDGAPVAVSDDELPPLTAEIVREILEDVRR